MKGRRRRRQEIEQGQTSHHHVFDGSKINDGEGERKNDTNQTIIICGDWIFLYYTKKCYQHTTQDGICQIRSDRSTTGIIQGT